LILPFAISDILALAEQVKIAIILTAVGFGFMLLLLLFAV
jgi:hypothetical protein